MTISEIREICLTFPGITEDIKWENHLCFNIGGKMFLVTAPDNVPVSASFKTSDEDFDLLPNRPGFIPAPYMARNKWIFVDDISRLSNKEWQKYLQLSYELILSKLSKKLQSEISEGKKLNKATPTKRKVVVNPPAGRTGKKPVSKKKTSPKKKSIRKKSK